MSQSIAARTKSGLTLLLNISAFWAYLEDSSKPERRTPYLRLGTRTHVAQALSWTCLVGHETTDDEITEMVEKSQAAEVRAEPPVTGISGASEAPALLLLTSTSPILQHYRDQALVGYGQHERNATHKSEYRRSNTRPMFDADTSIVSNVTGICLSRSLPLPSVAMIQPLAPEV